MAWQTPPPSSGFSVSIKFYSSSLERIVSPHGAERHTIPTALHPQGRGPTLPVTPGSQDHPILLSDGETLSDDERPTSPSEARRRRLQDRREIQQQGAIMQNNIVRQHYNRQVLATRNEKHSAQSLQNQRPHTIPRSTTEPKTSMQLQRAQRHVQADTSIGLQREDKVPRVIGHICSPRHKWSDQHRLLLITLMRWFEKSYTDFIRVLNAAFEIEISTTGAKAMWDQALMYVRKGNPTGRGYPEWMEVHAFPFAAFRRSPLMKKLQEVADGIGVALVLREEEHEVQVEATKKGLRLQKRKGKGMASNTRIARIWHDLLSGQLGRVARQQVLIEDRTPIRDVPMLHNSNAEVAVPSKSVLVRIRTPVVEPDSATRPATEGADVTPPLLYRFYDDNTQGLSTPTLLRAATFEYNLTIMPHPPMESDSRFISDAANHLNGQKVHGPFLSLADSFFWCMRKAMLSRADGQYMVFVDSGLLKEQTAVYVSARLIGLVRAAGEWRIRSQYKGSRELLAWAEIKEPAITHYVLVDNFVYGLSHAAKELLHLQLLGSYRCSMPKIRGVLRKYGKLLSQSGNVLGEIATAAGLNARSEVHHLQHFIADMLQGWRIKPNIQPWDEDAIVDALDIGRDFVRRLVRDRGINVSEIEQEMLMLVFRDGVSDGVRRQEEEDMKWGRKR